MKYIILIKKDLKVWTVSRNINHTLIQIVYQVSVEIYKQLLNSNTTKVELVPLVSSYIKNEWVQCSNGFCEFDSHTTTKYTN